MKYLSLIFLSLVNLGIGVYLIKKLKEVKSKMGNNDETTLDEGLANFGESLTRIETGVTDLVNINKAQTQQIQELLANNPDLKDEIQGVLSLQARADAILKSMEVPKAPDVPVTGGETETGTENGGETSGNVVENPGETETETAPLETNTGTENGGSTEENSDGGNGGNSNF